MRECIRASNISGPDNKRELIDGDFVERVGVLRLRECVRTRIDLTCGHSGRRGSLPCSRTDTANVRTHASLLMARLYSRRKLLGRGMTTYVRWVGRVWGRDRVGTGWGAVVRGPIVLTVYRNTIRVVPTFQ